MDCQIRPFRCGALSHDLEAMVTLWNRAACAAHGFYPLTLESYAQRVVNDIRFQAEGLLLATLAGEVVAALHLDVVRELPYDPCGVVEIVLVAPDHRRRGIGSALLNAALYCLRSQNVPFIDGLGCWPYSPFYATLIDGSERSGAFLSDPAMLRLFEAQEFRRGRESLVMRLDLSAALPALDEERRRLRQRSTFFRAAREEKRSWLDFVFRGWRLFDHKALTGGRECSHAIYGRMAGVSDYTGREVYALFGVNTPPARRSQGWATLNLHALLEALPDDGAQTVELHVHADNGPAVRLYRNLGFVEVGVTTTLRRAWK